MEKHQDDSVTLTPAEWAFILKLFDEDRGWSQEELLEAIFSDGWMEKQEDIYKMLRAHGARDL